VLVAGVRVRGMRTGIVIDVSSADRARLEAVVADRNSSQKHVWRARIVLLSVAGVGTNEIMRQAGVAKTAVRRWREHFMQSGVRDKTRPSRIPPLARELIERVVPLTAVRRSCIPCTTASSISALRICLLLANKFLDSLDVRFFRSIVIPVLPMRAIVPLSGYRGGLSHSSMCAMLPAWYGFPLGPRCQTLRELGRDLAQAAPLAHLRIAPRQPAHFRDHLGRPVFAITSFLSVTLPQPVVGCILVSPLGRRGGIPPMGYHEAQYHNSGA
jgi:hypothetical protein